MAQRIDLLSNESATGVGRAWAGGRGQFKVAGTFAGATVKLQILGPDGATWQDVGSDVTLTAAGLANFDLPPGTIRAGVAGGSPSGLHAEAASL